MRILLVEDNAVSQKVAAAVIRKLGHAVDAAVNGQEALDALATQSYDLVLMDCQMPLMDGYEATSRIRNSTAESRSVPVIAMTASSLEEDLHRCLEVGMDETLVKPVDPAALASVIERWQSGAMSTPAGRGSPTLATCEDQGVFDRPGLLERLMGDEELADEIVHAFIEELPSLLGKLQQGLTTGDLDPVRHAAHTIKGAAANVSASRLSAAAEQVFDAAVKGAADRALALVPELETQFDALRRAVGRVDSPAQKGERI